MTNEEVIGSWLKVKREEAGYTLEEMEYLLGKEYSGSTDTLVRLERGTLSRSRFLIFEMCEILGCSLCELETELKKNRDTKEALESVETDPYIGASDDNDEDLNSILSTAYPLGEDPSEQEEAMETQQYYREVQRIFYPRFRKVPCHSEYTIFTLIHFLIYLPLFRLYDLYELLCRVEGCFCGKETYILDWLWRMQQDLKKSKAKEYADHLVSRCNYDWFLRRCKHGYSQYYANCDKKWQQCGDAYMKEIHEKKELLFRASQRKL